MSFILPGTILSRCFPRKVPVPARSHRALSAFKRNFLLVSVGSDWGLMPEHQPRADGPVDAKVVSVEAEKVRFLAGSKGCTLKQAEHDARCFQSSTNE